MTEVAGPTLPDVQLWFLERLGLRLGPEMAAYVLRRIQTPSTPAAGTSGGQSLSDPSRIPVIGGDARTGLPVRKFIEVAALLAPPA